MHCCRDARYARLCCKTLLSSIVYFWDSNNKSDIFEIIKIYVL